MELTSESAGSMLFHVSRQAFDGKREKGEAQVFHASLRTLNSQCLSVAAERAAHDRPRRVPRISKISLVSNAETHLRNLNLSKRVAILYLTLVFAYPIHIFSQSNPGFESGLANWEITGNVTIDNANAREGHSCARIEGRGSVMQRIELSPFSIIEFDMYVKCSNEKKRIYSFLRFYDAADHELLEYKSDAIGTSTYKKTGNYTEAPPYSKHATVGIESDSSAKGVVYVDELTVELNTGSSALQHQPKCNLDQYMVPFWKGDTVYNETILMYAVNGKKAVGNLLYRPEKILSIKSFDLNTTYKKGVDYLINGNRVTRNTNSKMPYRADTSFDTKNNLAWFNLQSQWVVVTYTHKDKWNGPMPLYKGNNAPGLLKKLKSGSPIKIIAYGMSITRGLNVSGYDTVPPFMPTYLDLFTYALKKKYKHNDITLYNAGLPGAIVSWGAQYADKYISPVEPDLVILDFGMNDFWRYTPEQFKKYVETIIFKIKTKNPDATFLLLSNMKFDPDYILGSDKNKPFYINNMIGYNIMLKQLETTGIVNLDMTTLSDAIYHRKKAKDCIANPLHPNDYLARWYAQSLAALFIQ